MRKVKKYLTSGRLTLGYSSSPVASLLGYTSEALPNYNFSALIGLTMSLYLMNNLLYANQNILNNTNLNIQSTTLNNTQPTLNTAQTITTLNNLQLSNNSYTFPFLQLAQNEYKNLLATSYNNSQFLMGLNLMKSNNPLTQELGKQTMQEAQSNTFNTILDSVSSLGGALGSTLFSKSGSSGSSGSTVEQTFNEKFQNSTFGKNYLLWSEGLNMANNMFTSIAGTKNEYEGDKGNVTQGIDSAYDTVQGVLGSIPGWGQAASLIMGANKLVGNVANKLGGGTDGMCVCAGTKVFTAHGELINIEDLKPEDGIIGWNENAKEIRPLIISHIIEPRQKKCVRLELLNGITLDCSIDHPIYTLTSQGWKFIPASNLFIDCIIGTINSDKKLEQVLVKSVILIGVLTVYNLQADNDHTYLANGIITHNTTTDAILGSSFFLMTPIGLINGFGGKKSDTITKNDEVFAQVGSSYGGSESTVNDALTKSGKKYGLFSSSARKKANAEIAEAKRQLSVIEDISAEATDRLNIAQSMSAINLNRYQLALQGGYQQANVRAGKKGMSLELILKSKLITKAQEGLKLDPIQYSILRFPILKNVHVVLQYDPQFLPEGFGNIEYMQAIHDDLPYYIVNGSPYLKKEKGKSVIVYNDKANEEDVALDMLSHGLREQDKHWRTNIIPQLENEEAFRNAIEEELFWEYGISPKEWHGLSEKEKDEIGSKIWEQLNADLRFGRRQIDEDYNLKYNNILDGLVRALLVKDEYRKSRGYDYPQEFLDLLRNTNTWKKAYDYIMEINTPSMKNGGIVSTIIELVNPNDIEEFKEGGSIYNPSIIELVNPESEDILEFLDGGLIHNITVIELVNPNDIEEFKEGGSINIIPEGALHARKHHMDVEGITQKGIPVVDNKGEQQAEIEREEIIYRLEVTKELERLCKIYYDDNSSSKDKDEAALLAGKLLVQETLYNTLDNTNTLL